MASVLKTVKPAAKYDAQVEARLGQACRRVRILGSTIGLLGFVLITLLYTAAMVGCGLLALYDRRFELAPLARQAVFAGYALVSLVYLTLGFARPLCRRVNPYYVARVLEKNLPNAKNSLVSWLDLRRELLAPAIRSAVSQRAARQLARLDVDSAISSKAARGLGLATGTLLLALLTLSIVLAFLHYPVFALLGQAFAPFDQSPLAARTRLQILAPQGGNASVPVERPVRLAVQADGWVPESGKPEAPRVLFRYAQDEPYDEQPLERETGHEWSTTFTPSRVQNGFWYKIAGGDAETPEYRITVRPTPLVTGLDVTYHYRPYVCRADLVTLNHDGQLRALRGTEVSVLAHTNRAAKSGRLDLETAAGKKAIIGDPITGDPNALRFRFVIERDGHYRIGFTSADGESNPDPAPHTIQAVPDNPPQVALMKPEQDEVVLPANGLLRLEGAARDDIGVQSITLHLRKGDGTELQPKVYREGKSFRLADGSYPRLLEYQDFVELDQLKLQDGRPAALAPGSVVEFWLEASDNCDYPQPNVGVSAPRKRVRIAESQQDAKQHEQDRTQAAAEQNNHEAQQDEREKKENEALQNKPAPEQGKQPSPSDKQAADSQTAEPKPKTEDDQTKGQNRDPVERLADALDRQPGEVKNDGQNEPKGENKGEGKDQKPGQAEEKGPGKGDSPRDSGERKDPGKQKPGENSQPSQGKDQGKSAGKEDAGAGKPQPGQAGGDQKDNGQSGQSAQQKADKGQGKGGGSAGDKPAPGEAKSEGAHQPGQEPEKTAGKGAEQGSQPGTAQQQGIAKGDNPAPAKSEAKSGGKEGLTGAEPKGRSKEGGQAAGSKEVARGEQKAGGSGTTVKEAAQAKDRGQASGAGTGAAGESGSDEARARVEALARALQGADKQKRDEAARQLSEMAANAPDPSTRQAAQDALKQSGQAQPTAPTAGGDALPTGQPLEQRSPATAKGPPRDQHQPGDPGALANGANKGPAASPKPAGEAKGKGSSDTQGAKAEAKQADSASPAGAGHNGEKGSSGQQTAAAGMGKGMGATRAGGDPQALAPGTGDRTGDVPGASAGTDPNVPSKPEPRHQQKATDLQLARLEDLKQRIKQAAPEVFQQLKTTRAAELARVEAYEEMLMDQAAGRRNGAPSRAAALPDLAPRVADPGSNSGKSNARSGDPGLPPPEFRDSYRRFTSRLSGGP